MSKWGSSERDGAEFVSFHFSIFPFCDSMALLSSLADPDDCPGDLNFDFHSNLPSFYVSLTLSQTLDLPASEARTDAALN